MKKFMFICLFIVTLMTLVGCIKDPELIDVTIVHEDMSYSTITVDVIVPLTLDEDQALSEIAYSIASQVYESKFEEIGFKQMSLTIQLYSSQAQFDQETMDYGYISFKINDSQDAPGLSLLDNQLVTLS